MRFKTIISLAESQIPTAPGTDGKDSVRELPVLQVLFESLSPSLHDDDGHKQTFIVDS
ncbi:MAG: hypothetical protein ABI794_02975 [Betaproteobacteria bacterium]